MVFVMQFACVLHDEYFSSIRAAVVPVTEGLRFTALLTSEGLL